MSFCSRAFVGGLLSLYLGLIFQPLFAATPAAVNAASATQTLIGGQPPAVAPISGYGNNPAHPAWGTVGQQLLRRTPVAYADGVSSPARANGPSARAISNAVSTQDPNTSADERNLADWIYAWGQFVDHDLDLTRGGSSEALPIPVPAGDPQFDPGHTGNQTIGFFRSIYDPTTGTDRSNPRQQVDGVTSFLDASTVYGPDSTRSNALRTFKGGLLKTSPGPNGSTFLPINNATYFSSNDLSILTVDNDAGIVLPSTLFIAGDRRCNENIELLAVHTLFLREHNRLATAIAQAHPGLSDEQIFQWARAIVRAEVQAITYNEWLPAIIGPGRMTPYHGFNPNVNPNIATEFSTAALRVGHSLLGSDIQFLDNQGNNIAPIVSLKQAFFYPPAFAPTGPDPLLKYLATDNASRIDPQIIDDVRNFLFGLPGQGGFDLAARNIQRGRDHGLTDYNHIRQAYLLHPVSSFAGITSNARLQAQLQALYGNVDNIDPWVGLLAEDHMLGTSVGPTITMVFLDQFQRLRDGDRFWYETVFSGQQLAAIMNRHLADVIRDNTTVTNIQDNVFFFSASLSGRVTDQAGHGLANVEVMLTALAGPNEGDGAATTTDASGNYSFTNVNATGAGAYSVEVDVPAGWQAQTNPLTVQVSKAGPIAGVNFTLRSTKSTAPSPPNGPRPPARPSHTRRRVRLGAG